MSAHSKAALNSGSGESRQRKGRGNSGVPRLLWKCKGAELKLGIHNGKNMNGE